MTHQLIIDITPNTYAAIAVAGMAIAGLALGTILDIFLTRLGIDFQGGPK